MNTFKLGQCVVHPYYRIGTITKIEDDRLEIYFSKWPLTININVNDIMFDAYKSNNGDK